MTRQLAVGQTYRSKRKAASRSAFAHAANDRRITALTALDVEYEYPGRQGIRTTRRAAFLKWADLKAEPDAGKPKPLAWTHPKRTPEA